MANLQSTTIAGGLTEKSVERLVDRSSTMFTDSTASNFTTSAILFPVIAFNPQTATHSNQFVIAYADADDGNKGKIVAGTVSGTTITWGTVTTITSAGTNTAGLTIAFDSKTTANRLVVAYRDVADSNYSKAVVMIVENNLSITRGPVKTVASVHAQSPWIAFAPQTPGKFAMTYWSATSTPAVSICSINDSTNVITVGTPATSNPGDDNGIVFWDPYNVTKFVWAGRLTHVSNHLYAMVGQIASENTTTITWQASSRMVAADTYHISGAFNPNVADQFVLSYSSPFNSTKLGKALVGTISGSTGLWTIGANPTEYTFNNASTEKTSISFDPHTHINSNKFVISFLDTVTTKGTAIEGTLTDTTIVYDSKQVFNTSLTHLDTTGQNIAFDPNSYGKFVVTYAHGTGGAPEDNGSAIVGITQQGTGVPATVALPQKGSTVVFESTNTVSFASSAYDISTNKYVVAYRDDTDAGKGKAIVGTPSGDSVIWGTPVQFSTGETTAVTGGNVAFMGLAMAYDPDTERIVIAWSEGDISTSSVPSGAGKGTSKVGTVSGTGTAGTITFGSEGTFDTGGAVAADSAASSGSSQDGARFCQCMTYDTTNNKMVLIWNKASATQPAGGQCAVGTIVGGGTNTITWGTAVNINPIGGVVTHLDFEFPALVFDPSSGNIVVVWEGETTSLGSASFIRVGTVSGTSITFGTTIIHSDYDADDPAMSYDPVAEKVVLVYQEFSQVFGQSDGNAARVVTVSGSGVTATCHLGYPVDYDDKDPSGNSKKHDIVYNTSAQRHLVHYSYYIFEPPPLHQQLLVKSAKVTGVTLTCTTTADLTTVTTADTSSLAVGMSVSGTGMGVGTLYTEVTTIVDITSSTTFKLSVAAVIGGTTSLTFTSISFSGSTVISGDGTANYGANMHLKMAYNSADNKMLLARPGDPGHATADPPSGTIIHFNGIGLTVDLVTGSFFEVDLDTVTKDVDALIVSNPHASQVSSFILQITQGLPARVINWDSISNVKWPGGTAPTLTTTNNKVDTFSFTTWDNGTSWYGKIIGQDFAGVPKRSKLFGERGVLGGMDYNSTQNSPTGNALEYITISTLGNSTIFGNFSDNASGGRESAGATSDASRGVWAGGSDPPNGAGTDTIDYITIATTGNAIDFGNMVAVQQRVYAGTSNGWRGVFHGGATSTVQRPIDYITIATPSDASDFGDMTVAVRNQAATSDGSRGVFAGGYRASSAVTNVIEYITIATLGDAIDFGVLLAATTNATACSNGSRGLFAGGNNPTNKTDTIQYITIATLGNAIDFGNLTVARNYMGATSNGSRGVFMGGVRDAGTVHMDYVTIQDTGNASNFGDLIKYRNDGTATSGN